jgi:hypothetical protein
MGHDSAVGLLGLISICARGFLQLGFENSIEAHSKRADIGSHAASLIHLDIT